MQNLTSTNGTKNVLGGGEGEKVGQTQAPKTPSYRTTKCPPTAFFEVAQQMVAKYVPLEPAMLRMLPREGNCATQGNWG